MLLLLDRISVGAPYFDMVATPIGLALLFGARIRSAVPSAVGFAGILWAVFVVLLGLPLPVGSVWTR